MSFAVRVTHDGYLKVKLAYTIALNNSTLRITINIKFFLTKCFTLKNEEHDLKGHNKHMRSNK